MSTLRALVFSPILVGALVGCPAIVGIDDNYSAGGHGPDDGGQTDAKPVTQICVGDADGSHDLDSRPPRDTSPSDTSLSDTGPADTSKPRDTGSPPPDACSTPCTLTAPSGWKLVAFEPSQSTACPSRFSQTDVVEPALSTGSCSCTGCTVTTSPCENGFVNTSFGNGDCTADTGFSFPENNGKCVFGWFPNCTDLSAAPVMPVAGYGTSTATGSGPSSTPELFCTPTDCPSDACEPSLGPSFNTCLYQTGNQTCPGVAPNKHLVGSSASVSCGACSTSVTATGCSGSLDIYSTSSDCSGSVILTVPTDGVCAPVAPAVSGKAYIWNGSAVGLSCNAGTAPATVDVMGQGTICCP